MYDYKPQGTDQDVMFLHLSQQMKPFISCVTLWVSRPTLHTKYLFIMRIIKLGRLRLFAWRL